MTFTTLFTITHPAGVSPYITSSTLNNKINELIASGDLISKNITIISDTEKKLTMVWKDKAAYDVFVSWQQESGVGDVVKNHLQTNSITINI